MIKIPPLLKQGRLRKVSMHKLLQQISVAVLLLSPALAAAAPADDLECDKCVEQGDFAPNSVSQGKFATESITAESLDDRSVTANNIAGGSITQGKFEDQMVTTIKIRDGAVTDAKLAPELATLIGDLKAEIDALDAYIEKLQAYIEVDETSRPTQPTVRIVAANLQIVNGSNSTLLSNATGNLIIGYNEAESFALDTCSNGAWLTEENCTSNDFAWGQFIRDGSHNVVIGPNHSYSRAGGLVLGFANVVNRDSASVSAGRLNSAAGSFSSISGGYLNRTPALVASIAGGANNFATGIGAVASGGSANTASGNYATISGGNNKSAANEYNWSAGSLLEAN